MLTIFSSISTFLQETKEVESASLDLSQGPFKISNACLSHLEGAKTLADANRHIFGFVTRGAFHDALQTETLIVATRYGEVVGFLRYHHRKRDLQTTLYDICVAEHERGKGLGQDMLTKLIERCHNSNRATILLKCPSYLVANAFYEKNGFCCISTIEGKRQKLNVWQLDLTSRGQQ